MGGSSTPRGIWPRLHYTLKGVSRSMVNTPTLTRLPVTPGHPSSFENPVGVGSSGPFSSPAVLGSRLHCLFLAASVSGSC